MPYGAYKSRNTITLAALSATDFDCGLGRIPDQVLVEKISGDADLEFGAWDDDGTVIVTNNGFLENVSEVVCEYNHSLTK